MGMDKHKDYALERWSSMSLSLGKSGNKKYLEYNKNNYLCESSLFLQLFLIKWDLDVAGVINTGINYIWLNYSTKE